MSVSSGSNLFINYRREDTAPYVGRLYDRLTAHFGPSQVFIDIDQIEPGEDFVEAIERKVGACEIAIVSIGPKWLTVTDETGRRRIDDPEDFVRTEIAVALQRNIRVIPVLVGGATMPRKQDLPEGLAPLARRNAIELSETRFHADVTRLIEAIERARTTHDSSLDSSPVQLEGRMATRSPDAHGKSIAWKIPALVGIALVLGGAFWFFSQRHSRDVKVTTGGPSPIASPQTVHALPTLARVVPTPPSATVTTASALPSTAKDSSFGDFKPTLWSHNGSTVLLRRDGKRVSFVYRQVRAGLREIVPDGAILFEGVVDGEHCTGKARRFKKGLPTLEYEVSGSVLDGSKTIELIGNYPKRNEDGQIVEYIPEKLRFDYIGSGK